MNKYLYGASVQGIQEHVFKTGKLKEIVGASEIVESICTEHFKTVCPNFNPEYLIIGAAGNIKYIFKDEDDCKRLVRQFPKSVMDKAPGITISQAVVKYEENSLKQAIDELEFKLKTQRNIVPMPYEIGFMGLERARRTGGVAFEWKQKDNEAIDEATYLKQKVSSQNLFKKLTGTEEPRERDITLNIEDITKGANNKWIAVVHADGNGLGALVQELAAKLKDKDEQTQKEIIRKFSIQLEECTKKAARKAFSEVCIKHQSKDGKYPIRPIIMGGDDITFVIRGDFAMDYTKIFLDEFENQCKNNLEFLAPFIGNKYMLTSCAGIAYVKESYPFHYAVDLSEKLCKEAKSFSKDKKKFDLNVPPSSLSFYKVQDSFIESDLKTIRSRTGVTSYGYDYNYGPYLIKENGDYPSISQLNNYLVKIENESKKNDKSKAISKLRQLISESFKDKSTTEFMKERMKTINSDFYNILEIDKNFISGKSSILYDLIQLHNLKY